MLMEKGCFFWSPNKKTLMKCLDIVYFDKSDLVGIEYLFIAKFIDQSLIPSMRTLISNEDFEKLRVIVNE